MRKFFGALFIFLFMITSSHATNEKLFCGIRNGLNYKKEVDRFRNDKTKHCALSCMIAVKCPNASAYILGYLKEMWDLISPGDADARDIAANNDGIRVSEDVDPDHLVSGCIESCLVIYPSK